MNRNFISLLFWLSSICLSAQSAEPQMADSMRADGKIWIVICVIAIIFISLAAFMLYIERKVKKIEDQLNNK